jgi:predicted PhzF superfamily epimerase YddE/YHI9
MIRHQMVSNTPLPTTQALRAFCGSETNSQGSRAGGNPCLVTLCASPPEQAPARSAVTQCLSWPLGERRAGVSCWTAGGTPIQCCGHGLMCCAASWINRWGQGGTLIMNGSEVACRVSGEQVWLGFTPLPPEACQIPAWCPQYFEVGPDAAATAGDADGYLVLAWPAGFELASLPTPDESLAQRTQRSLIITCATENHVAQPAESIRYRYFAPQYGVSEDAATGSAMRVLASFWQQRGLGRALTAYQCSRQGGLLFSSIEEGKVWIGGWTSTMAMETANLE